MSQPQKEASKPQPKPAVAPTPTTTPTQVTHATAKEGAEEAIKCSGCGNRIDALRSRFVKATLYYGESKVNETAYHEGCFQYLTRTLS